MCKRWISLTFAGLSLCLSGFSDAVAGSVVQPPESLTAQGLPAISTELMSVARPYLEFRQANFQGWHPQRREIILTTRFAESMQLHVVKSPGAARKQLTFLQEPVSGASWQPKEAKCILLTQDSGGGENYQFYKMDATSGKVSLLTDGKSRNTGARWSRDGGMIAFASNARTGNDTDIWVMDPNNPEGRRLLGECQGGGWGVADWSPDGGRLLIGEYVSINESRLWLMDARSGAKECVTPDKLVARDGGTFSSDGKSIYFTSDEGGEFRTLGSMDLATKVWQPLTGDIPWDVEGYDLSPDGRRLVSTINKNGVSRLYTIDTTSRKMTALEGLPLGVISGVEWAHDAEEFAFTMTSARAAADVYSWRLASGELVRWTESETGGLDANACQEPELVELKSFDGLAVSGFLYRPYPNKFPGKRPVLINIHGGPEGQSRPGFMGRNNFYLQEEGVAILFPNVRGSEGYGKSFLKMDNGFLRKDSVKDVGAFLDFIAGDASLDKERTAVVGGSYGGYMVLACMIDYAERLRCGCDVVGISNFLTFLQNTSGYRRDLRRAEYGDEREEKMREYLRSISPTEQAQRIKKPLYIVQGKNDPRVPVTEALQMAQAVRAGGTPVWYLEAADEGHGFAKKKNVDFQFLSTIQFWRDHLLK